MAFNNLLIELKTQLTLLRSLFNCRELVNFFICVQNNADVQKNRKRKSRRMTRLINIHLPHTFYIINILFCQPLKNINFLTSFIKKISTFLILRCRKIHDLL